MNETRNQVIWAAVQTIMMETLLEFLDEETAVNFNSFTIANGEGIRAIVTVQRPDKKNPIERYHEVREANDALNDKVLEIAVEMQRITAERDAALAELARLRAAGFAVVEYFAARGNAADVFDLSAALAAR